MAQIGNVLEIVKLKRYLEQLQAEGLIQEWELPYENLLTRVSAAIFFLTPAGEEQAVKIWDALKEYPNFSRRENTEKTLSQLQYRVTFEDPNFK